MVLTNNGPNIVLQFIVQLAFLHKQCNILDTPRMEHDTNAKSLVRTYFIPLHTNDSFSTADLKQLYIVETNEERLFSAASQ